MSTPEEINISPLYKAILEVYKKIASVAKTDSSGVPYSFVSKDIAIAAVRPAMIEAGLIVVPSDVEEDVTTVVDAKGKVAYRSHGKVTYRLIHVPSGSSIDIPIPSMAIDYSDKATNQFLGYAIKNFILQTFFLQSGETDPDAKRPEAGRPTSGQPTQEKPARRTVPDDSRRISWNEDQIKALKETGVADHPAHAATLLNRPDVILGKDAVPEWVGIWASAYKNARYDEKTGEKRGEVADAVEAANLAIVEYIVDNVPAELVPDWVDADLFGSGEDGSVEE